MLIASMLLRYLHIILGITWFGGTIYRSLILLPGLVTLSPEERRPLLKFTQEGHETFLLTTGLIVIVLGIMLGAVVGPIQSSDEFFTYYGLTWVSCMILAAALLAWEGFAVSPAIAALAAPESDECGSVTLAAESLISAVGSARRAQTLAWLEVVGFGILLSGMILMHFGY